MTEPLGSLVDIVVGKTPARAEPAFWGGEHAWLSIADMNQGPEILRTKERITDEAIKRTKPRRVEPGTPLLSFKLSIGKTATARVPLYTNEAIAALPIKDPNQLNSDYLIRALAYVDLASGSNRAAMGATLNRPQLEAVRIPLPPLPEQRRIASILDQVDNLRTKRRDAIGLTDQLFAATFLQMFGDPRENPNGYTRAVLGDVVVKFSDGPHVSPTYQAVGVPFLSMRHVRGGQLVFEDLKYISQQEAEVQWRKCKPARGDLVYTKGGTTGLAATVETDEDFAVWVHLALLKPNPEIVDSVWLTEMLNSPYCYAQAQALTRGIANRDLGLRRMPTIQIVLPPLRRQQEYARDVAFIRSAAAVSETHLAKLDELFASLQHRAFAGEL